MVITLIAMKANFKKNLEGESEDMALPCTFYPYNLIIKGMCKKVHSLKIDL